MRALGRVGLRNWTCMLLCGVAVSAAAQTSGTNEDASTAGKPEVAFTFDDLPAHGPLPPGMARPDVVKSILSTLRSEKMPPVYGFVNGFRVAQYPYQIHILQAWRDAGEPLGSHTWSHPELDKLSAAQYEQNIARNEPLLNRLEPHGDWHWFRYPFLEEGDTVEKREDVRQWLTTHRYRIAEVSIDFQDYLWNEPYARCMAKADQGAIVTLHDSYLAAADQYIRVYRKLSNTLYGRDVPYVLLMHIGAFDAHMLPELLALFRSRGFSFITLEQAMADPAYHHDPKVPSPGGTTFNEMVATERKAEIPDMTDSAAMLDKLCR